MPIQRLVLTADGHMLYLCITCPLVQSAVFYGEQWGQSLHRPYCVTSLLNAPVICYGKLDCCVNVNFGNPGILQNHLYLLVSQQFLE